MSKFNIFFNRFTKTLEIDDLSEGADGKLWPGDTFSFVGFVQVSEEELEMIEETAGQMEEGGIERAIADLLLKLVENHFNQKGKRQ